ncbi:MAG: hypothetical protein HY880_08320 [Deltaproteobacteria bacterium]|nr:hypothetical protein [Deltaproteobacteria bacterium]
MRRFKNRILAKIFTRFPSLLEIAVKGKGTSIALPAQIPWTLFKKPLKDSVMAIVTTAGVHLKTQEPFDMLDPDGDPTWRELPSSTPKDQYMITHDYYDHADADMDINIVFPVDRLNELKNEGIIGGLSPFNYGFMGHIKGRHIRTLMEKSAEEVSLRLKSHDVDVVILTPG